MLSFSKTTYRRMLLKEKIYECLFSIVLFIVVEYLKFFCLKHKWVMVASIFEIVLIGGVFFILCRFISLYLEGYNEMLCEDYVVFLFSAISIGVFVVAYRNSLLTLYSIIVSVIITFILLNVYIYKKKQYYRVSYWTYVLLEFKLKKKFQAIINGIVECNDIIDEPIEQYCIATFFKLYNEIIEDLIYIFKDDCVEEDMRLLNEKCNVYKAGDMYHISLQTLNKMIYEQCIHLNGYIIKDDTIKMVLVSTMRKLKESDNKKIFELNDDLLINIYKKI